MDSLNKYRECYYVYDGNMVKCEREVEEFNRCQENPKWYLEHVYPRLGKIKGRYNEKRRRSRF